MLVAAVSRKEGHFEPLRVWMSVCLRDSNSSFALLMTLKFCQILPVPQNVITHAHRGGRNNGQG